MSSKKQSGDGDETGSSTADTGTDLVVRNVQTGEEIISECIGIYIS